MSSPDLAVSGHESLCCDELPPFCGSPNSSETIPGTPPDESSIFGSDAIITPTPYRSSHATPPTNVSMYKLGLPNSVPTYSRASQPNRFDQASPIHPLNFQKKDTLGHTISHFWTPGAVAEPKLDVDQDMDASQPRWGPLNLQGAQNASMITPVAHNTKTKFGAFIPGHRQNISEEQNFAKRNYENLENITFNNVILSNEFSQNLCRIGMMDMPDMACPIRRNPQAHEPLRFSNSQGEILDAHPAFMDGIEDTQEISDLGIDILRLSPKAYQPAEQPAGAPHGHLQADPTKPFNLSSVIGHHGFTPMQAVMQQTREREALIGNKMKDAKFSDRYHGMHTDSNASAEHLTTEQNCALWLTNLPPGISTNQLLTSIRNIGRIWCSYINYPDYVTHQTAAAKVVFFEPKAAQKLLSMAWTKGLFINGYRIKVSHNRIKYAAHAVVGKMSRVLVVTGRADFVNEVTLTKFFKDRFIFQVDEVVPLINAAGRAVVEFKFGSYRCQSQMGKMSLEKDRPDGFEKVEFGDDPCEVGDTLSSYGIAADRIQGRGL